MARSAFALLSLILPWLATQPSALGANLVVSLNNGEVFLHNPGPAAVTLTLYQVSSASSSLSPSGWTPIAGRIDSAGDSSFDPTGEWVTLSQTTAELSEAVFGAGGGLLVSDSPVSLGLGWNANGSQDLLVTLVVDGVVETPDTIYSPLGDYNLDGIIDAADFGVFHSTFGSTTDLRADGNANGEIDAADYTVWRDALPAMQASFSLSRPVANPEPSSIASALLLVLYIANGRTGLGGRTSLLNP